MGLDIYISGYFIISLMAVALVTVFIWGWLRKDTNGLNEEQEKHQESELITRQILFNLENNTDEEFWLDLVRLDANDKRYNFNTSDGNYPMLVEYLKVFSFNVVETQVNYQHENWQSDILYNYIYTPFGVTNKPVFVGFDNFEKNQLQRNSIHSFYKYNFDFFNTIAVKLSPNEKKAITLNVSEQENGLSVSPPKCALLLKNISDEPQTIRLFDKEYWAEIEKMALEGRNKIDIQSVFGQVSYVEVLKHFNSAPLNASLIKLFIGQDNADSSYKLNFDEEKIIEHISDDQEQNEVVEIDLGSQTFIALFDIELKPKTEIYISFK